MITIIDVEFAGSDYVIIAIAFIILFRIDDHFGDENWRCRNDFTTFHLKQVSFRQTKGLFASLVMQIILIIASKTCG